MLTTERLRWYKDKLEKAESWNKDLVMHWCGLMRLFDIMLEDSEKDDKERL